MFKTIFGRLFWLSIGIMLGVTVMISAGIVLFMNYHFNQTQYNAVVQTNTDIENALYSYISMQSSPYAFSRLLNESATLLDCDIVIFNRDGAIIDTTNPDVDQIPYDIGKKILNGKIYKKHTTFNGLYSNSRFIVAIPMTYRNNIIGGIAYNCNMATIKKSALKINIFFSFALTIAVLIAFGIIFRTSRKITSPLGEINAVAMDIAAGKFDRRVKVRSRDEIGQLASSFNFMADSLEKQNSQMTSFISDVSHEMRTPMTSISGFVSGILDGTIPPEQQSEYLSIVKDEADRLAKMVNEMLDISKMSSKEYKLNVSQFDLTELIRRSIIELAQKIEDNELDLNVEMPEDEIDVVADKDAIKRVMINLLDNAIKFSEKHTTIQIKVEPNDRVVAITVGNFGVGISNDDINHIFDRFYKGDSSRTGTGANHSGAGLGLSFVKNIISLHKQTIVANSRIVSHSGLKYTTFTFTLELA